METAQSILAKDPSARLIVSSGYSNDPLMEDYNKHGIHGTLIKQYNAEDLTRALAT